MCKAVLIFVLHLLRFSANEIQRLLRGILGRSRAMNASRQKQQDRHAAFLHYLCIQLQRCFRGFYSRKYKHDQHRRKQYCRMIAEQGEKIIDKMHQYSEEQAEVRY